MNKDKIKARLKLLEEISPWPWTLDSDYDLWKNCPKYNDDNSEFMGEYIDANVIHSFSYSHPDAEFMETSPQFESDLIKAYEEVCEENEEWKVVHSGLQKLQIEDANKLTKLKSDYTALQRKHEEALEEMVYLNLNHNNRCAEVGHL